MPPLLFVPGIGDTMAGVQTALAILAALFCREREGVGQFIDTSALGSMVTAASSATMYRLIYGVEYPRRGRNDVTNPLVNTYECQDGKWIYLAMMQSERYWSDFCEVVGVQKNDPNFLDAEARRRNHEALISTLDGIFMTKPREAWLKILEEKGNFIFGPVQTFSEMIDDPQVLENAYVMDYDHPSHGRTKTVGFPSKFSKTPASIRKPPPEHGQHTEEILLESDYTWDEIGRLKDLKIIL